MASSKTMSNSGAEAGAAGRAAFLELADAAVEEGRIRVTWPGGETTVGRGTGPLEELRVHEPAFFTRVLAHGNLGMGEAFMDGWFDVPDGRLPDLLTRLLRSRLDQAVSRHPVLALRILGLGIGNRLRGSWKNVRAHYDLGDDLFESFLDPTLTYSCGYATSEGDDLAALQRQKLDRICEKLQLSEGERLLDIGCGFGGLLMHAARERGVTGVGISVSERHAAKARERIEAAGLAGRLEIRLADHRSIEGTFDKVVSVGMMEHLRPRELPGFVRRVAGALRPDGLALLHYIGCGRSRNEHDPFTQRYVFPGSDQPRLSAVTRELERNDLAILDVENLIRHYALTARRWLEAFRANAHRLPEAKYDARFRRMWEYYLSSGVAASLASDGALYQVLAARDFGGRRPLGRV